MGEYIVTVDQSTSASKVFLVDNKGEILRRFSKPHKQYYPQPGYAEHDAEEIWQNVLEGIRTITADIAYNRIAAIAISNQRETTVIWDRETGAPVLPAIVWQDVRAESLCHRLRDSAPMVKKKTGLELSAYYPAAKAAYALGENPQLREKMVRGELCVGTVDSYLVYRMTQGKVFATDVSNASRTEMFNIHSLSWDAELCTMFGISMDCLAAVLPSDGDFGVMAENDIPITGVMGDSHAALFGQGCMQTGMTKATFGTGSSVMMNVGTDVVESGHGLSASVGFGYQGKTHYVLEGNVTCSGDTLCWLRDAAQMVEDIDEVEPIARSVESTEGVYFVPAFSGLSAPYFDSRAKAAIVGMHRGTTRAHIVRAALESIAFQDADIIRAMAKDTGAPLGELRVDGGPVKNTFLMQLVSDLTDCCVRCTNQSELSALGAAYMAGITKGVYPDYAQIPAVQKTGSVYVPTMEADMRREQIAAWETAVRRCHG